MPLSPEYEHVFEGTPDTLFSTVRHFTELLPKVIPDVCTHAERHEGDGRAGTIATYTLAKRHPGGGSLEMKSIMEGYDEATHTYILDMQGDPRYSHMRYHVSFLPGPSAGTSLGKWFVDYIPVDDRTPAPEHLLEIVILMFEKLGAHGQPPASENANSVSDPVVTA